MVRSEKKEKIFFTMTMLFSLACNEWLHMGFSIHHESRACLEAPKEGGNG
jgi:hypothetical protein